MIAKRSVRNFCIVAHIDHGKSTLADRILELTGAVPPDQHLDQVLDQMELERERGITIKASAVRLEYLSPSGPHILNLIDTPGHVDFSYEVSRALAACEGALLVVDATQGVQAQTVANFHLAQQQGLTIIPVVNKIDLDSARPQETAAELEELFGIERSEVLFVSAKTGQGVAESLEAVVQRLKPPTGDPNGPLQALIFDSYFDRHRGVVAFVRLFQGALAAGQRIKLMSSGKVFEVDEVGIFTLRQQAVARLEAGEVGYVIAGIKDVRDARVGDTITHADRPAPAPLQGYRPAKPMVFCGFYPIEPGRYEALKDALEKLSLNDAALHFQPESSVALGLGFRCGFLGVLHLDITQERIEREHGVEIIATAPSVVYEVVRPNGSTFEVHNPADFPAEGRGFVAREPWVKLTLTCPNAYVGPSMELAQQRRGQFINMTYHHAAKVTLEYEIPLGEIIFDFFEQLKSRTSGYASYDYEFLGYRDSDLTRLNVLVNGEPVDALSTIVHRSEAYAQGKSLVERLRKEIPRQLFEVRVQAAAGNKIIASETIPALRKHVTAKCYGGDITRKRKLLEKQKAGKKRMKQIGRVEVPQEAFLSILKVRE